MPEEPSTIDIIVPRIVLSLPKGGVADVVLKDEDFPIENSFVADLIIFYAFNKPSHFTMVANRDLVRLSVEKQNLHKIALGNLRRTIPQPELHDISNGVFMLTCGGNFEATILLLDEVWTQLSTRVTGELVAAVPARDVLLFTGTENQHGLGFMRSKVSHIIETGDHVMTRSFLIKRDDRWAIYEGFAA